MQSSNDIIITEAIRTEYAKRWINRESTIRSLEYIKMLAMKWMIMNGIDSKTKFHNIKTA